MTTTTATPCPSRCVTVHSDMPPGAGFRASPSIGVGTTLGRLWLGDRDGARPGVVIADEVLSEDAAHDLGLELVRAADVLRRTQVAASK